ncbi:MAG: FAD-binding oxidoreductase [Patescibacteria group bacterium]
MIRLIDNLLNKITMYRLVLYFLIILVAVAGILGSIGFLPFSPLMLLLSVTLLTVVCYVINKLFSLAFNAPTNVESVYITALILTLIITPPSSLSDISYLIFIFWAATWAMASKYILAIGKKHIFNPAAFGVALTALTINQSASWWIGTASMAPFVIVGGLLVVRKIRRFDFILSFLTVALIGTILLHVNSLPGAYIILRRMLLSSPLLFFATIMLSEPLTTPPKRYARMGYGALVGAIFDPSIHLAGLYSTPELALLLGNIISYILSPKKKLMLRLIAKEQIAKDTYQFSFTSGKDEMEFHPGQYLEWTLPHKHSDSRGNRRYFTIASSPVEENFRIGVKFYPEPSSFKKTLLGMKPNDMLVASGLAGEFIMPHNKDVKLCFMAGGIGITPFESMLNYMLERKQHRDVIMLYSNKTSADIAYLETIKRAQNELGIRTVHVLSDTNSLPTGWQGESGFITAEMIKRKVPDWNERIFFISGPHGMVNAFKDALKEMGVHRSHIKIDFFPGFA